MENALIDDEVSTLRSDAVGFAGAVSGSQRNKQAQAMWNVRPMRDRIKILKNFRREVAGRTSSLTNAISAELSRTSADTLAAEVLPLLAACRFLEDSSESLLAVKRLGKRGLPFWLSGVDTEVHRVPLGSVLVIGPANYPLFIPGVQVLQALIAGNAVIWKPGRGGYAVAEVFLNTMLRAGFPEHLLQIAEDTIAATNAALDDLPDKVLFTGSAEVGRILMRRLAETLTPCVMELSGCDAVIVLPSADLARVAQALTFGMRLNGSETCMAPRRVLLVDAQPTRRKALLSQLEGLLSQVAPVSIRSDVRQQLYELLHEAELQGAHVHGDPHLSSMSPVVVTNVHPSMRLAQADIFAPILSVIEVVGEAGVLAAQEACSFALTAAIFGDENDARQLAQKLVAGCVLINDIIVPTADPRLAFGGRRSSGFGVTRGAEGLLEMTAIKTVVARRGKSQRHYEATTSSHVPLFDGLIAASHSRTIIQRLKGLKQMAAAGKVLSSRKRIEEQHGK